MSHMASSSGLLLLLLLPLSSFQSSVPSEQEMSSHQALAAPPAAPPPPPPRPAPPHSQGPLQKGQTVNLNAKETHALSDKHNAKVGLFIAASIGTFALMAGVYCIYNRFYTKQQYLHTQLHDDSDQSADPADPPPVFFHVSADSGAADIWRAGYGSLTHTPSIISVPPSMSPPLAAIPFPPLFLSSHSLRTISAKDLQKSCS